ncbi:dihydropteroate synthase [Tahibacter amnicola]|uniref:Dihydropteroate synthase n=1 Tax=Tahibacter amnicola TaxID=2976241 RepID=A0ABY6BIY2_9GAMM|nr:dihydropteroate synthase [Tahibacter amnicola]UXI69722.1 dihydropteroate synthase [Tahibacter amnicola]
MFYPTLSCNGRELVLDRPLICGIVNTTPDSFSDGGRHADAAAAIAHGLALVEQGADLLDIGGESTRPGATAVSAEEELARVIPVIEGLARQTTVPLSIDTSKPDVMRAAVAAGAGLINDVQALRLPGALDAAAELKVPVCLMHMQGEPRTMQEAPNYEEVVADVKRFLADRIFTCELAGIDKKRILVDPGFGFGKSLEHNLELLRQLKALAGLGVPLMVGLSRKSMLGTLTGREVGDRVVASAVAALIAVQRGAGLVRVHDVAATRDALAVWAAVADAPSRPRTGSAPRRWDDDE